MISTPEDRATFKADGVVKISQVIGQDWLEALDEYTERELANQGNWGVDTNPGSATNRQFSSRYNWQKESVLQKFITESPMAQLTAELMGSATSRFYFDHLLVKEPGTADPTPWHQDIPYWPFLGSQICSSWLSLSHATVADSSLEFIRRSHDAGVYYTPVSFDGKGGFMDDFEGEACPDIEADRESYDIVGFDVEPGDALIFSAWALHGAPGNGGQHRRAALSTRWLGDDATWSPHPGSDPTITQADICVQPGEYPADDKVLPLCWPASAR